jgi:L-threonylcarbamoyladenylate synthase
VIVAVGEALARLRAGEVIAYPTETVYGLGADALSRAAVERVQQLKGRAADRGLSLLIGSPAELERWVGELPALARRLAQAFWPGPLTLVLRVRPGPLDALATEHGVGFRCSPQPTASALAAGLGSPLISTSANRSGEPPCTRAGQVAACFGDSLPIAGGEDAGGQVPSTVVALAADGRFQVLREGPIAAAKLSEFA